MYERTADNIHGSAETRRDETRRKYSMCCVVAQDDNFQFDSPQESVAGRKTIVWKKGASVNAKISRGEQQVEQEA